MYKINKGLITEKIDDKTVIFDDNESVLYTFNETAGFIFNKLKKGLSEREITQTIIKKYKIREEKAKRDIKGLISELLKNKIIF